VTDRTDFLFPTSRTVGESDGWGKYGIGDNDAPGGRARFRDEKRREDRLRRAGHPVARWEMADAVRVEPLATALQRAYVRLVRPRDRAGLASLRQTSRALPTERGEKPQRRRHTPAVVVSRAEGGFSRA
jgi:hypothetical protein